MERCKWAKDTGSPSTPWLDAQETRGKRRHNANISCKLQLMFRQNKLMWSSKTLQQPLKKVKIHVAFNVKDKCDSIFGLLNVFLNGSELYSFGELFYSSGSIHTLQLHYMLISTSHMLRASELLTPRWCMSQLLYKKRQCLNNEGSSAAVWLNDRAFTCTNVFCPYPQKRQ